MLRTALFYLVLLSSLLLVVGCGGGDSDFVANPGAGSAPAPAPSPGTTGNLAFRFVQAQSAVVPVGTQKLQFDFFDAEGKLTFFAPANFATSVTVNDVPITCNRVTITAYGAGGVPLVILTKSIVVEPDQTVAVDMSGVQGTTVALEQLSVSPSPLTLQLPSNGSRQLRLSGRFSNGDTVTLNTEAEGVANFSGFNSTVAAVNSDGVVTAATAGNTSVNVSYTLSGKTVQAEPVGITVTGTPLPPARLVFSPPTVTVPANASTKMTVTYFGPGATEGTDVTTQTVGVTSVKEVSYTAGTVSASSAITNATSTVVLVTYNSGAGQVTGSFNVNVTVPTPPVPPSLGRLSVSTRSITVTSDGLLGLLAMDETRLGFFEAEFIPNGQTVGSDVTKLVGVSFKNFFPSTVGADSYSYLYLAGRAVVTTANPLGPAPPVGSTATMTVSYIYNGAVYTDDVTIVVGDPALDRVEILGSVAGNIRIPTGPLVYRVQAIARYTNGFYEPVEFDGTLNTFDDQFSLVESTTLPAGYTLTLDKVTATPTAAVSLPFDVIDPSDNSVYTSFNLQLVNGLTPAGVTIVPSAITVEAVGRYRVVLNYSDGTNLDVTGLWPVESVNGLFSLDVGCGCAGVYLGNLLGDVVGADELSLGSTLPVPGLEFPGLSIGMFGANATVDVKSVSF